MKNLLTRLKLIQHFTIEIEIEKSEFVSKLEENVDDGDTGVMFSAFEGFSSSKNHYKGSVGQDRFKIRRRRKIFDMNMNMSIANGSYVQKNNTLAIETEVNGFHNMFIPYYILIGIIYITGIILSFSTNNTWTFSIIPFIIIHACIMMGLPYFIMRRSVERMKYELERDFYFMNKK